MNNGTGGTINYGRQEQDAINKENQNYNANMHSASSYNDQANQWNQQAMTYNSDAANEALQELDQANSKNAGNIFNNAQRQQLKLTGYNQDTMAGAQQNLNTAVRQQEGIDSANIAAANAMTGAGTSASTLANLGSQQQRGINSKVVGESQVVGTELSDYSAATAGANNSATAQVTQQGQALQALTNTAANSVESANNYITARQNALNAAQQAPATAAQAIGSLEQGRDNYIDATVLKPAQAQLAFAQSVEARAQANAANAQAGLYAAETTGQNQENQYNAWLSGQQQAYVRAQQARVARDNKAYQSQLNQLNKTINSTNDAASFYNQSGIVGSVGRFLSLGNVNYGSSAQMQRASRENAAAKTALANLKKQHTADNSTNWASGFSYGG